MNHINATQTFETPAKTAIYENEQFHQFASFKYQKHVIITNGEKGFATLSSEAKEVKFHEVIPVESKQIIDTNGAGKTKRTKSHTFGFLWDEVKLKGLCIALLYALPCIALPCSL